MKSLLTLAFVCIILPEAVSGLSCYSCDPTKCDQYTKQTCAQGSDRCLAASAIFLNNKFTLKTCAGKEMCDAPQAALPGVSLENVQCCQSNLCNGAESFTRSFLLLVFIPLLSSFVY